MNVSVIGAGSWGSAFALYLGRLDIPTKLWVREKEVLNQLHRLRENSTFLPGFTFPKTVTFHNDLSETLRSADIVFIAVPSNFCRTIYKQMVSSVRPGQTIVSLTKGIEEKTLLRMSQVIREVFPSSLSLKTAALSGPSFAKEVAQSYPTAVVVASSELEPARKIQHLVSGPVFRCYTSADLTGVELSGAVKNVIAIAAGISDGLEYGSNTRAALITRGIAELTRLGLKMGARMETFSGLAGIGDLVLTCTGKLSRNRHVGEELGRGKKLADITSRMKMVAEGVTTTASVYRLSLKHKCEMPICTQVHRVLYEGTAPETALKDLMTRRLKNEFYD